MFLVSVLFCFFIVSVFSAPPIGDDPIIALPDGQIKGTTYITKNNKTYYGFQKIPFAQPPIGDLRLEAPQPATPWTGILDTTEDAKSCITTYYLLEPDSESEDCLYMNVYVPQSESTEKLPVLVWIYGGGFTTGSSSKSFFGPDFLIEKDVIVVSFNYRIGPLGFISTGDNSLPGNLGLKDQNLALNWTKNNIEYFGGDAGKITIFGQSAGGASVGLHLVSKKSSGLFRAAILESGSAINYWAVDQDPKTTAYLIADAIPGANYGNDTLALKNFLKNVTVDAIITANTALPDGIQVWPTLENDSDDAFLTVAPYQSLENGSFNQVPIIIGVCSQESLYFLKDLENTKAMASLVDLYPTTLIPSNLKPASENETAVIERIKNIYLKNATSFLDDLVAFANVYGDNAFVRPSLKHAELSSQYVPVYLYEFSYYGARPMTEAFIDGAEKAGHAAELPYLFNIDQKSDTTNPLDLLTQERLVTLWTNFAKYLNPTPEEAEVFNNITWPILDSQDFSYLEINGTLELRTRLKVDECSEWTSIYENCGSKPFITF